MPRARPEAGSPMDKKVVSQRNEIAGRLRTAREAAGLSQGQVARRLGLHRPTISEIEAGRRRVSVEELDAISHLYGVESAWILRGRAPRVSESDKIMLAARQLSELKDRDLERLVDLLQMLRGSGGGDASD